MLASFAATTRELPSQKVTCFAALRCAAPRPMTSWRRQGWADAPAGTSLRTSHAGTVCLSGGRVCAVGLAERARVGDAGEGIGGLLCHWIERRAWRRGIFSCEGGTLLIGCDQMTGWAERGCFSCEDAFLLMSVVDSSLDQMMEWSGRWRALGSRSNRSPRLSHIQGSSYSTRRRGRVVDSELSAMRCHALYTACVDCGRLHVKTAAAGLWDDLR